MSGGAARPCSGAAARAAEQLVQGRGAEPVGAPGTTATSNSTACTAQARISTSSAVPWAMSSPRSMRSTSSGCKGQDRRPGAGREGQGCRRTSSARCRSGKRSTPARSRSAAVIWARLRNASSSSSSREQSAKQGQVAEPARQRHRRAIAGVGDGGESAAVVAGHPLTQVTQEAGVERDQLVCGSCPRTGATSSASSWVSSAAVQPPCSANRSRRPAAIVLYPRDRRACAASETSPSRS